MVSRNFPTPHQKYDPKIRSFAKNLFKKTKKRGLIVTTPTEGPPLVGFGFLVYLNLSIVSRNSSIYFMWFLVKIIAIKVLGGSYTKSTTTHNV